MDFLSAFQSCLHTEFCVNDAEAISLVLLCLVPFNLFGLLRKEWLASKDQGLKQKEVLTQRVAGVCVALGWDTSGQDVSTMRFRDGVVGHDEKRNLVAKTEGVKAIVEWISSHAYNNTAYQLVVDLAPSWTIEGRRLFEKASVNLMLAFICVGIGMPLPFDLWDALSRFVGLSVHVTMFLCSPSDSPAMHQHIRDNYVTAHCLLDLYSPKLARIFSLTHRLSSLKLNDPHSFSWDQYNQWTYLSELDETLHVSTDPINPARKTVVESLTTTRRETAQSAQDVSGASMGEQVQRVKEDSKQQFQSDRRTVKKGGLGISSESPKQRFASVNAQLV